MKQVIFRREASADVREAYRWYEQQESGLGAEFREELRLAVHRLSESPHRYCGLKKPHQLNLRTIYGQLWLQPLASRLRPAQNSSMATPSDTQALLEKLVDLPKDQLAEVEDFVDFLRHKRLRAVGTIEERLQIAAEAGLIDLPQKGGKRSSVVDHPPITLPGRPLSEILFEDRR